MSILLLIDPNKVIKPILEEVVSGSSFTLKVVDSTQNAKVSLLEFLPSLVLSPISIVNDDKAGLIFCRELRDHPNFSSIPIALLADKVDSNIGDATKHFGAQAVLPFPIMASELKKHLSGLLPNIITAPQSVEIREETKDAIRQVSAIEPNQGAGIIPNNSKQNQPMVSSQNLQQGLSGDTLENEMNLNHFSENLQYAQRILATVLHNLKTSDLLSVIDMDEVPKAVIQMSKTVCEINDSEISVENANNHEDATLHNGAHLTEQIKT